MLFVTNRAPEGSIVTQSGRAFKFDLNNNSPSPSMYFCQYDYGKKTCEELGSDNFIAQLIASSRQHVLFFIHGFTNLPDDIFNSTHQLQNLCDTYGGSQIQVVPLIWPCAEENGIFNRYWSDRDAASASRKAFSRIIMRLYDGFTQSPGGFNKTLHIMAHSMGNYVLCNALTEWNSFSPYRISQPFFKNAFLVAADIEDDALEVGKEGEVISNKSQNVVVYFARDDYALASSKVLHRDEYYRLGAYGPAHYTRLPANVFAINCGNVNQVSDSLVGHSYYRYTHDDATKPGKVFKHIVESIINNSVAKTAFL